MPGLEDADFILIEENLTKPQPRMSAIGTDLRNSIVDIIVIALRIVLLISVVLIVFVIDIDIIIVVIFCIADISIWITIGMNIKCRFRRATFGPVSFVLQDLVAFAADAHVAKLDFRTESDDIDYLESKLTWIYALTMYVVCQEWHVQRPQMGN